MGARLRREVEKLDGQTELYLVLCLLVVALLMILGLVACNCALTCCRNNNRKKSRKRSIESDEYDADYFRQIRSLLQRQQIVEREWEERRRVREEYRLLSPEQATASLSRLASRSSSPVRPRRSRPQKSSLKSENELKDELANYKVNHTVRIQTPPTDTSPFLKRRSWSAIMDGKEIQLNEEEVFGGSTVIVRRFEPMKMVDMPRKSSIKKDSQQKSIGSGSKKRGQQRPSVETIV